jgi:hypothetical protein
MFFYYSEPLSMLRSGPNQRHGLSEEGSAQILLTSQMHCALDEVPQYVPIDEKGRGITSCLMI